MVSRYSLLHFAPASVTLDPRGSIRIYASWLSVILTYLRVWCIRQDFLGALIRRAHLIELIIISNGLGQLI